LPFVVLSALLAVSFAQPPNWHSGPCGISRYNNAGEMELPGGNRMVVGGIDAQPWEFPWQTSLRRKATNSHFCGGSIINDRWIVTASHCLSGETTAIMSVVIGDHVRNDLSNTVRQTHDVNLIQMHPSYNPRTLQNDVGLTRTTLTLLFTEYIQPICAPDPVDQYVYRKSIASGWGTLFSGGPCCPQTLQYVSMNITTNVYCNNIYPGNQVYADMICASDNTGHRERDTCQGDSGGPLAVKEGNLFRLIGIVSWGIGCASGYPGVYARVSFFHDWILSIIRQ